MIKEIPVSQLQPGMFVRDLNCQWMDHPVLFHSLLIADQRDIDRIASTGALNVFIDTERGVDVLTVFDRTALPSHADGRLQHVAGETDGPQEFVRPRATRALEEELPRAQRLHRDTQSVLNEMFADARKGSLPQPERLNEIAGRMQESLTANSGALMLMSQMKDRDAYTFQHCVAVGALLMVFAEAVGYSKADAAQIGIGGLLHDIGKMFIPDGILNKPGRLSSDEFDRIKRHPLRGYKLLSGIAGINPVYLNITYQHHERLDGAGYPQQLAAEQISREAKLAAIADVYDAVSSDRCYHLGEPPTLVLRNMLEAAGRHFDLQLVQSFIKCVGVYPVGSLVQLESGMLGIVTDQNEDLLRPKLLLIYNSKKRWHTPPQCLDLAGAAAETITGVSTFRRWGLQRSNYL
ncbi:MAG: HD-GYP domain-containing protein [Nevskia sp.]|nr:HD-GYP domain-containing protein [Nevskia sp.]